MQDCYINLCILPSIYLSFVISSILKTLLEFPLVLHIGFTLSEEVLFSIIYKSGAYICYMLNFFSEHLTQLLLSETTLALLSPL